ncbi:MAG TPA: hypothetical protein VM260_09255 [Pirellula sp.]|nr:hypothetical protein [Pirellula sp.]
MNQEQVPSERPRKHHLSVLILTSGNRTPSTRFRVLPFLRHLKGAGILPTVAPSFPQKYDYFPWMGFRPSQFLKRLVRWCHWIFAKWCRFDVILIERELFDNETTDMESRFLRLGTRVVLDLDDAVFLRYPEKMDLLARQVDLVIAGNHWIAEWVIERNKNCIIIPTGVELAHFPPKPQKNVSHVPVVGWIGTTGNLMYLEVAAKGLRDLAQTCKFELHIVVPYLKIPASVNLEGVRVVHIPWHHASEVAAIHKFDIGIMPLFSGRTWDNYKCPTKLIQYMSIGIPSVASPIGFTGEVLTHGIDGFYAASDYEWELLLKQLITDEPLRRRVGTEARSKVANGYCVESNWPVLAAALHGERGQYWKRIAD